MMKYLHSAMILSLFLLCSCGEGGNTAKKESGRVLYTNAGGKINTLDPALASDYTSSQMIMSFYDTLLQYDYVERPYKLIPSMLQSMPQVSADCLNYKFKLKTDLYFQDNPCFKNKEERRITSKDVVFSFLRLADARVHSSGFWLWRGKVKGADEFYDKTAKLKPGDMTPYSGGCEGFEIIDDANFAIHLKKPDPRLLYMLAMSYSAVVSEKAAEFYGNDLSENIAGSGPFSLVEWQRDYKIVLVKNPDFRAEYFAGAENPADRKRTLPLLDRVVCYLVKQPISGWLLFLQGELDLSSLDKENFEAVMTSAGDLSPALKDRGIRVLRMPDFQINYIGFSFTDSLLSKNLDLRKAISLAYNVGIRVKYSNYSLIPGNGPVPPGVPGYDGSYVNPYSEYNLEKAKEHLAKAGFPGGINPETGKPLELSFDLGDTSPLYRQLAELMRDDMKKIGLEIKPVLNNRPRFFQKLKEGQIQIFRFSWVGDYPDAENFLQLFYGPNSGSCNRICYNDPVFNRMYEEILLMPDSPERTEKYMRMSVYLTGQCPWIFESFPTSYLLVHGWLENYLPHDFVFSRWKYLSIDPQKRLTAKNSFTPIKMSELRNSQEK
jgi:oligopeptide transport system substrate-binding protein